LQPNTTSSARPEPKNARSRDYEISSLISYQPASMDGSATFLDLPSSSSTNSLSLLISCLR
jgi:hypothetical protein